jgi:large subunit ribosomal protein L19
MNALSAVEKGELKSDVPSFLVGDTVKVHVKIKEGDKERIQIFEGVVIARRNGDLRSSFTVRKISFGRARENFPAALARHRQIGVSRQVRSQVVLRGLKGGAKIKELKPPQNILPRGLVLRCS